MRASACSWIMLVVTFCAPAGAQTTRELGQYMFMADAFIIQDAQSQNTIFYSYSMESLAAKLAEFQIRMQQEMSFPEGALFIVCVTDHVLHRFTSVAADAEKMQVVVNLRADASKKPPEAPTGKRSARVLVVSCPPLKGIKSFAVKTADGTYREISSTELPPAK